MADVVIVADSGPLIGLACIGKLELVRGLGQRVLVPPAVLAEVTGDLAAPGAAVIAAAAWIEVEAPDVAAVRGYLVDLDEGEAEAVALAQRHASSLLLVDDKKARRVAKAAHQAIIGTVGLLAWAKREGRISEVKTSLLALQRVGIRLSEDLVAQILKDVGET